MDEEERVRAKDLPTIEFLIVEMSRKYTRTLSAFSSILSFCIFVIWRFFVAAVTDIDTSGIHAIEELYKSLQKRDVQVRNID